MKTERKKVNITLREFLVTVFILILAIIVLAGMLYKEKKSNMEISQAKEQVAVLEKEVTSLRDENQVKQEENTNKKNVLSMDEAYEIASRLYETVVYTYYSPVNIF